MSENLTGILKLLLCIHCRSRQLHPDSAGEAIHCGGCGRSFPIINGIGSFVSDDLINFTEVEPGTREDFLRAKKLAYSGDSFINKMYNHYHRYAAARRRAFGADPITVDIGFGIGEHYPHLSETEKKAASFIGIDLDRFKLEHFVKLHPEIPILQGSALTLPIADDCVDVVQLLATLEHFTPLEMGRVLDESLRILRPQGLLIASYPAEGGFLLRCGQKLMHWLIRFRTGFNLDTETIHHHPSSAFEVRKMLRSRDNLRLVESVYYPFGLNSINLSLFVNETYVKMELEE